MHTFAENISVNDIWDFTFEDIKISQNSNDPKILEVFPTILFEGAESTGTAQVIVSITDPDGKETVSNMLVKDIHDKESQLLKFNKSLTKEGTYKIKILITPPTEFKHHIFDAETLTYTVEKNGLEKKLGVIITENDKSIVYAFENNLDIENFPVIHTVINLPKEHSFEKIIVSNNEFTKDFPIDTNDIYLESKLSHADTQVHLIFKDENILPSAGAQQAVLEYVKFYATDNTICHFVNCISIDDYSNNNTNFTIGNTELTIYHLLGLLALFVTVGSIILYFKFRSLGSNSPAIYRYDISAGGTGERIKKKNP